MNVQPATIIVGPWSPRPPSPRERMEKINELLLASKFLTLTRQAVKSSMTDEEIMEFFRARGVTAAMLQAVWRVLDEWRAVP